MSEDQFALLPCGTRICFRDHGNQADPAILLVAGLGEDLASWGEPFVEALVSRGYRVITMDNRDVGQSSFMTSTPPAIWRQVLAKPRHEAYSLADMARDSLGVLNHLGVDKVHVAGRSMGGMIAQTITARAPDRVLSLTSLYSTTGSSKVGQPTKSTIRLLAFGPKVNTRADAVRSHLRITQHIAGAYYPMDEVEEASIAARAWDRSARNPADGVARQIEAIQRSGDRTRELKAITAPTLVIHGDRDVLVNPSGGAATTEAIASARLVVIPGMGHHIPRSLVEPITRHITDHTDRVQQGDTRAQDN